MSILVYFLHCSYILLILSYLLFFLFNTPPPTDIYTLSLHDALPISFDSFGEKILERNPSRIHRYELSAAVANLRKGDRKSTRLNSSHRCISYAVFCLKKKKKQNKKNIFLN